MRRFSFIVIVSLLWVGGLTSHAQTTLVDSLLHAKLHYFGIELSIPIDYTATDCKIIWSPDNAQKHYLGIFNIAACSPDKNCMILYPEFLFNLLHKGEDSADGRLRYMAREIMEGTKLLDEEYRYTDKRGPLFWVEDNLSTVSGQWVNKTFNADKLFIYTLPLINSAFNINMGVLPTSIDSFHHLIRIYFTRKEGAYCDLLMLLTDDGMDDAEKYLSDLKGHIKFDDKIIHEKWELIP